MYQTFEIDRSGRIATIWMNRLSVFNAFNKQLIVDLGMANEVTPDDALDANVATLAEALIAGAPQARKAAKDLITAVNGRRIDDVGICGTAQRAARQRATDEAQDGIFAVVEKRRPAWLLEWG